MCATFLCLLRSSSRSLGASQFQFERSSNLGGLRLAEVAAPDDMRKLLCRAVSGIVLQQACLARGSLPQQVHDHLLHLIGSENVCEDVLLFEEAPRVGSRGRVGSLSPQEEVPLCRLHSHLFICEQSSRLGHLAARTKCSVIARAAKLIGKQAI